MERETSELKYDAVSRRLLAAQWNMALQNDNTEVERVLAVLVKLAKDCGVPHNIILDSPCAAPPEDEQKVEFDVSPELQAVFSMSIEYGITQAAAVLGMVKDIKKGRFTEEHHLKMWGERNAAHEAAQGKGKGKGPPSRGKGKSKGKGKGKGPPPRGKGKGKGNYVPTAFRSLLHLRVHRSTAS